MTLVAGIEFTAQPGEQVASGKLLVGFRAGVAPAAVLQQLAPGATYQPVIPESNVHVVSLPPALGVNAASVLSASPLVSYVEPDRIRTSTALSPNDADYSQQWALVNIQALAAWGLLPGRFLTAGTAGVNRIRVAMLDTGADCTHPDFMNAGGASDDAAAGGQLLFSASKAYYQTTTSPAACAWQDDHGHGTHTAGIVAAAANNSIGVVGSAYEVELMIYKVLDQTGSGEDGTIAQAIIDAANNGASVISMSLGGPGYSQTFQNAINYAWSKNVLVVAAAGNSGSSSLFYPGGANHAVGVAATDNNDNWVSFSNYGNQVAVGAPGVNILSTVPTYPTTDGLENYGSLSGTSMAAPYVSALGGTLFSASPGITAAAVRMRIEQSADNANTGGASGQYLGYGRINFSRAVGGNLRTSSMGGVVGQVIDSATQNAVYSAVISIAGQTLTTDASGLFRINGIPAGSWPMTVTQASYATANLTVNVAAGADTECLVTMGGSPAQITGTITDHGTGVSGAVVEAISNGQITSTAVTASNGSYDLYVQAGTYTVTASAMYYVTSSTGSLSVGASQTVTANLNLPAMGSISGTVLLASGSPAIGAALTITGPQATLLTTDANGRFSTIGLAPGSYTVDASYVGLTDVQASSTVSTDSASTVNLKFAASSGGTGGSTGGSTFTPIRVRAGGGSVTDASGSVWSADTGFVGGYTYVDGNPVSNTTAPALYQGQRYNVGAPVEYRFQVPNGSYSVTLKFAETWFTAAGQRVANIVINGQTVQSNFDIVAAAGGPNAAIDETYTVSVTSGLVDIQLTPVVSNPEINAIQILSSTTSGGSGGTGTGGSGSGSSFSTLRIRAGGAAVTDSSGNVWAADMDYSGGYTYADSNPIANAPAPALYQAQRYNVGAPVQYQFAVPNGSYAVTLKFAETWFTAAGQRIANIVINGQTVQSNFDIVAAAGGPNLAVDETYTVNVTTGSIVIQLTPVVSNPEINALQIAASTSSSSSAAAFHPIYLNAGAPAHVDSLGVKQASGREAL